ncbi:MAG: putative exported protein [Collimonas fungivorans]|uniref:YhdP family protein n=1 Tax=Collimonas fungivorans TaxID=158899 RepID=UPI0026EDC035|nr:YhdP family protein [Collimonas fungivorans]MDB5768763.1 putative exported protein [Collimonas fungivorans]
MLEEQAKIPTPASKLAICWRAGIATYKHVNLVTHHLLGALLTLLVVAYFLFCGLFLGLRYVVLPNVGYYKAEVEHIVSKTVGNPISIGAIQASWHGLQPHLVLDNVVVHDKGGQPALTLPQVAATISWRSALVGAVRLASLEINKPDLQVERDAQGNLFVAGILVNSKQENDGAGAEWLLAQRKIVIRDGQVRWRDDLRKAPELVLTNIDLVLQNRWRRHQLSARATPPASFAAPLDVRANFVHPVFTHKTADVKRWTGTLYANLHDADLTVWKPYFDYPVEISQGKGAVQAWLDLDHAKMSNFTADLELNDLAMRLRPDLQPLALANISGRISAHEELGPAPQDGVPSFGANGHTITLTDFSLKTADGLSLPRTTISESYVPAQGKQAEKYSLQAKQLDLQTLASFAQRLPLSAGQIKMIDDFAPRGQLRDFAAQWQGAYPAIASYSAKGQFEGLTINAQAPRAAQPKTASQPAQAAVPGIPGVDNLSGSVNANQDGGSVNLKSEKTQLDLPGFFDAPLLPFDKLDMQARWNFQQKNVLLQIDSMNFVQDGLAGSLSGTHLLPLQDRHGVALGVIDMTGSISEFDLKKVGTYLPLHTPEHLRNWLVGALKEGKAKDVTIRLKGDLADFPFRTETANAKPKGEFSIAGKIENGTLEYDPAHVGQDGKQPLWPLLEKIEGTFAVDRTRLQIKAASAQTSAVAVSDVTATVPDLSSHDEMLLIDGSAAGALQNFVQFTKDSPVLHWIDGFTSESQGKGNAKLQLNLQLPLAHLIDAKVTGVLQFQNNDVILQKIIPPIANATGQLEFNEKGFNLNGIKGNLLGGPVQASGGTQADRQTLIKIEGNAGADGLRAMYPAAAMQKLLSHASGSSRYTATVAIRDHHPELVVESSLQGIGLDFPEPLRKSASEAMPFKFEWLGVASDDAAVARDELKLALGSAIVARYQRQKPLGKNAVENGKPADWKILRGGIGINSPLPEPDSGVAINMNAKTLNVDAWNNLAGALNEDGAVKTGEETPLTGLAQYAEPNLVSVRASQLILLGKTLDNVVLGATHQKNAWQVNIDSRQASGFVTWNASPSGRGLGKVTARLSSLIIPQGGETDVGDVLEGKGGSTQIPGLDIIAEDFQLLGKKLGRLELSANNVRANVGNEWRIHKLSIKNPDAELKADGKWTTVNGDNTTSLTYAMDIADAGKLLDRFGFAHVLRAAKGRMDGEVSWKGLPFTMDIPSLSGQINLDMAAGQFLKVDPGAAKLLGVLSLQSLPRRLTLDFRDIFSEGFAFDSVVGTASITEGKAHTDNFKMRGVSATVLMDGVADIARETQDLHVAVLPEINAGTASVVALAINPVIGIGTFLAQLFLRDPLMRAFTFEYNITGGWTDPVVTKLDHKTETPTASTPDLSSGR